jgi:hypothetical protein
MSISDEELADRKVLPASSALRADGIVSNQSR